VVQAQVPVLRGVVLDAETQQPVPNARIGLGNNRIGTSANTEGRFALAVPASYQHSTLEVSMMGYQKYQQPLPELSGSELRIVLRPQPMALSEVTIQGSVLGIVREAVARIPQNYPVRPTRLAGFFRESDSELPDEQQYLYLAEAVLTAFKAPYTQPKNDGEIVLQQSRKVDLVPPTALFRQNWYAGPFIPHRFDFVHNRMAFINEADFKDYDYRLTDVTTYAGRTVYVVAFGPKAGNTHADFEGQLFIDEASYAFLAAEWHRTPAGIRHENLTFDSEERAYRTDYQLYAGRWHLKSVWYSTRGQAPSGKRLRHLGEFLTTAIDTAAGPKPGYTERAQFRDVFLHNTVRYDSTFWQGYTTLLPPERLRQVLTEHNRQQRAEKLFAPQEATQAGSVSSATTRAALTMLERFRYGVTAGLLPVQTNAADVSLSVAPTGSQFKAQTQRRTPTQTLVLWRGSLYQYNLPHHLSVHFITRRAIWNFRGRGWEAGATYAYNLRPKQRPVLLRVGLSYTQQRLRYDFGTFDNADRGLALGGTALAASKLSVALQQRTTAWLPRLGVGLELSHRTEFMAEVGALLAPRIREELHVAEESGFFLTRAKVNVPLADAGATVSVADKPAVTPWALGRPMVTMGLIYRLR
jgi:hypothetical protein